MQQQSAIYLVDLGDRASPISRALKQVGHSCVSLSVDELGSAFETLVPVGIVASARHVRAIGDQILGSGRTVPFFVLAPDTTGSLRPLLPAVTASLSEQVDPGILALRMQKALQHVGSMPPSAQQPVRAPSTITTIPAPDDLGSLPPASTHRPVAMDPADAAELPSSADLPSSEQSPSAASPRGTSARRWVLAAVLATAAAGVAAFFLLPLPSGAGLTPEHEESTPLASPVAAESASEPQGAETPPPAQLSGPLPTPPTAQSPAAASSSEGTAPPELDTSSDDAAIDPRFAIAQEQARPSCEDRLEKTEADFASAKPWRSVHSWKLARQSLMKGQAELAHAHMCESAFIDPTGPATAGLVKFYLTERDLAQAERWAQKAVEVAPSAGKKREAQQLLGDVLNQRGQLDAARRVWLESFGLTAEDRDRIAAVVRSFIQAAVSARKGGDAALAERLLRRAVSFEPEDETAVTLLAATLEQNGQPALAERWADIASRL